MQTNQFWLILKCYLLTIHLQIIYLECRESTVSWRGERKKTLKGDFFFFAQVPD